MSLSTVRSGRAFAALAGLIAAFMALSVSPAQASSMFFSKSSGRTAEANWLEVGTLPGGVLGNIHFGYMQVEELSKGRANVWGNVIDMTCPEGVIPDGPPGHGGHPVGFEEEPPDNGCTIEAFRFIDGGNVTFTMDKKLTRATLTGTLNVFGHEGGPGGTPQVNMTWVGVGDITSTTETGTYTDGTTTYSYRYSFTGRSAQIAQGSRIGAMIFDDVAGEWSTAQMGSYRSADRSRTR